MTEKDSGKLEGPPAVYIPRTGSKLTLGRVNFSATADRIVEPDPEKPGFFKITLVRAGTDEVLSSRVVQGTPTRLRYPEV